MARELCLVYDSLTAIDLFEDPNRYILESLRHLNLGEVYEVDDGIAAGLCGVSLTLLILRSVTLSRSYAGRLLALAARTGKPLHSGLAHSALTHIENTAGNFEAALSTRSGWSAATLGRVTCSRRRSAVCINTDVLLYLGGPRNVWPRRGR